MSYRLAQLLRHQTLEVVEISDNTALHPLTITSVFTLFPSMSVLSINGIQVPDYYTIQDASTSAFAVAGPTSNSKSYVIKELHLELCNAHALAHILQHLTAPPFKLLLHTISATLSDRFIPYHVYNILLRSCHTLRHLALTFLCMSTLIILVSPF